MNQSCSTLFAMTFSRKRLWLACVLSTFFVFGAYTPMQAQIAGLPDTLCITDAAVTMTETPTAAQGGVYSGNGVSGTSFNPATAGAGTHTVTYNPPSYTVSSIPFVASSGAGTTISLGDEATSGALPIGFTFEFFNVNYTSLFASSNGFLTFSSGQGNGCCSGQNLPAGAAPNNLIAFAWEDLDPGNGLQGAGQNRIWYQTLGTPPNRQFRYNFRLIDHFSDGNNVTGMVILYETSNNIEVHLQSMPSDGGNHTEGIENLNGTLAYPVSGRNAANWSATNSSHRWTPDGDITQTVYVGADVAFSLSPTDQTCGNTSDGQINLTNTAGTPNYSYAWSNSSSSQNITGLNAGTYIVTVSDAAGCQTVGSATVALGDVTPPTALCNPVTVQLGAGGTASTTASAVDAGSTDACGIASTSLSQTAFNCSDLGANAVTLTVTDNSSLTNTCTDTVYVEDNIAPTAVCQPVTAYLNGAGTVTVAATDMDNGSSDNCSVSTRSLSQATFTCSDLGANFITLTINDPAGNSDNCANTITVLDTNAACNQPPTAVCQNVTVNADGSCQATVAASAVNNGSSDPESDPLTFSLNPAGPYALGVNNVQLLVTDGTSTDSCAATITVNDATPPVASCQPVTVSLDGSGNASITGSDVDGGSTDNCSIASLSVSPNAFTCSHVGGNGVTLTVTDGSGNTATCGTTVTVEDTLDPTAVCNDLTLQLDGSGNASTTAATVNNGSTDNCAISALSLSPSSFNCSNIGSNSSTLTVTDANGNSGTCTATITIEDTIQPNAVCNNLTVSLDGSGNGSVSTGDLDGGSSDNCGSPSLSASPTTFNCSNVGSNSVTLIATDGAGNIDSCVATVTVEDTIPPTASCLDITIQLDGSGNASITASNINNGSADACGIGSLSAAPTSFSCSDVGLNNVTLTVTDNNGNTSTCNSFVTVEDTLDPTANCANITAYLDGSGNATITAGDVDSSSTDNCSVSSLSATPTAFTCSNIGSNTVTLTVTDVNGNTSNCTSTVTVEDSIAPVANCDNETVSLDSTGNASIVAGDVNNGSTDNCGTPSISVDSSSFNCSHVGTNTVTLTVTDGSGNSSTCTATVTVEDNIAPIAVCQNVTVQLNGSGIATLSGADLDNGSSDICGIQSLVANPDSFTCLDIGSNSSTLTVTDNNGNTASCVSSVTVADTVPPNAVCQNLTVTLDGAGFASVTANDVGSGSSDNCSGSPTLMINGTTTVTYNCSNTGTNSVSLSVTDGSGNTDSCSANITVQDTSAPVVGCTDITIQLDPSGTSNITLGQIHSGSTDNCGVASTTASQLSFSCPDVGVVAVVVTSTDVNGNVDSCTANVTVQDTAPANFTTCPSNIVVDNIPSLCLSAPVNYPPPTANSVCGIDSVVQIAGFPTGTQFPVGVTTNTFVAYTPGVNDTCTFTVTVNDTTSPELTGCLADTTIYSGSSNCESTYSWTDPVASDNCPGVSFSASLTSPSVLPVGMTTLEFVATDASGNTDSCSWTVTVLDTFPPVWSGCPSNMSVFAAADSCGASVSWTAPVASDNCELDTMAMDTTDQPGDFFPIGTTTVTYTAVDTSGNSEICTFTVTVSDTNSPELSCTPFTLYLDVTGNGTITIADVATFSDSCGIDSATISQTAFTCADTGANVVTVTVTDNNGNVSSCSPTVTVEDTIPPAISCTNITVQLDGSGSATIVPTDVATFSDACGILSSVVSPDSFDCSDIGSNLVTVTITDNNNNVSTCFPTVTVEDTVAPVAVCQNITVQLDATGNATITAADVDGGSSDACGIDSLSVTPSSFDCSNRGTNTVTLTATDNNGVSSTCTATVTVEDSVAPIAVCQDLTVSLDGAGNGSITPAMVDNGSSDACGIANLMLDNSTFSCADVGSNTVTLTVTDSAGNTATCTAGITVEDTIPPIPICQDLTVQLDAGGSATITAAMVNNGSSDACGISSLSLDTTSFGCSDIGMNTVTLTVTDSNSNSATCTAIITVEDTVDPVAVCQNITVQLDASGNGTITAADVDGGSSDACGIDSLSVTPSSFTCANVGMNSVTLTATDDNGNSSTCTATVMVMDTVPPVAICQDITVQLDGSGNASITAADVDNGSNDACGIDSLSVSPSSFTCANVGGNTATLTVTDVNGNVSTCLANVTIEDTIAPTAVCQDLTIHLDAAGSAMITPAMVDNGSSDNCAIDSLSLDNTMFGCGDVGSNTVTLTATDVNGNTSTCTSTITVEDTIAPILSCNAYTVFLDGAGNGALSVNDISTFSDACGIDSTSASQTLFSCADVASSPISVTVFVNDSNGNSSSCTSQVTVSDTIAPSISCPNDTVVGTDDPNCSALVNIPVPITSDNCLPIIVTNSFNFTGNASGTYNTGTTTVLFTAIDPSGNSDTCSMTVTVLDDDPPALTCPNDTTVYVDSLCNYVLHDLTALATATDNCSPVTLSQVDSAGTVLTVGVDTVTITAVDTAGNSSSCVTIVTVEDTTSPTAVCQNITVQLDGSGNATITAADIDGGSTDNCGVMGISATPTAFTCANLGMNPVVLTVNDVNGNSSTCTATVMIQDTIAPTISCQDITVQLDAGGSATITQSDVVTVFADNCTANTPTLSDTSFSCADTGMVVVTATVTDQSGNSASCTSTITVEDTIAPIAVCQDLTLFLDSNGDASTSASDVNNGSSDNCGIASIMLDDSTFTCADTGSFQVTLTVTDVSSNASTCTSNITLSDTVPPVAVCQDLTLFLDGSGNASTSASDVNNGSSDNCGIASIAINDSSFTCADTGSFTVTLTVTDVSSNVSTCTSTITLSDTVPPTALCQDLTLFLDGSGNASTSASDVNNGSSDNCGIASIMLDDSTFTCADTGSFQITLTVTDVSGNASSCQSTITLSDSIAPIAVCQNVTVFLDGNGDASITPAQIDSSSSDNCGIASLVLDIDTFSCADVGANTVVLTVTDVSGNSDNCSATVMVMDTTPATAVCTDTTVYLDASGNVSIDPTYVDGGSTDNCGIDSLSVSPSNFDCSNVGSNTVTLSIVDVNGNSSSCTANVTVSDTLVPIIVNCPGDQTLNNVPSNCGANAFWVAPTASDNCGSVTVVGNFFPGQFFPVGSTDVIYTATDTFGNVDSCVFTITVLDTEDPVLTNCSPDITVSNDPGQCGANVTWGSIIASDNCPGVVQTSNFNSGDFFGVDTTLVVFIATDAVGNTDTCSFNVVVEDDELPVLSACPSNITQDNDSGFCSASVTWTPPTASDNCDLDTLIGTDAPGDIFPVGTTTVTYYALDTAGNVDSCSFDITVNDTEAPVAICPANITVSNDSMTCGAAVSWTLPGSTDNCGIASETTDFFNGSLFPIGMTTVTLTATDSAGNSDTCSFTVTVNDTEVPTLSACPSNITQSNDNGECSAIVGWIPPTASDNCPGFTLTSTHAPGDTFSVGMTTVTYTVVDASGNSDSCSFTVAVNDTEAPVAICPAPIITGNDSGQCGANVTFTLSGSDNCGIASSSSSANSGDFFAVGTTTVNYTVTDSAGNTDSCSFFITVQDTEAPVTVCPTNITVSNDSGQCGAAVTFTLSSSDNCGVLVTSSSSNSGDFFPVGTTTVNYFAADSALNTDSCSFDITVNDTEAPVAICPANITVSNDSGLCAAKVNFTVSGTDNCGIASSSTSANSGDLFPVGTTTISHIVTDSAGNTDSCSFTITVNDTEAPAAICPSNITLANDSGQCGAAVAFTLSNSDNCGVASAVSSANSGDFFGVGTTTVSYVVTDSAGNVDSCSFDITVNDTEAPMAMCPAPITVSNDSGQCGAAVTFTLSNSDNCGVASAVSSANSGDFFAVGTTTVSYVVTDSAGNVDSCSFDITVNDTEAPVAICPSPITVSNDSGQCGAVVTFTLSNSDNCGIASAVSSANSGDFFAVGTTTVSYTVTDSAGNVDSCSFDITVNDTEAPMAICPAPITVSNDSGQCGAVVTFTLNNSDNCGVASAVSSANSGDFFAVGTTTVSYVVTDSAGNVDSCSFDITVNDTEAPMAMCPAPITVSNDSGQCGAAVTFTLSNSDNCGVASAVSSANSGDFFAVGTTTVSYVVTDSAGNTDSCSFDITVNDTEAPVAICPAPITVSNDSGQCGAAVTFTLSGTDNCGIASSTSSANSGDFFAVGTTTVSYTVVDSAGNVDSCSFDITVNDTEAPMAMCPAPITVSNDSGQCGAAVTFTFSSSDNCGVASTSSSANSGDFFAVGTTTVSYIVTDSAGNVDSCSFDITVNDTEAPVAICPAPITVSNDSGQCGAAVTFTLSSSDNCGVASEVSTSNSGDFFPVGVTSVTYVVTDSAGNVDSCAFDVTVNDTEAPVAICPAPITVSNDSGQCGAAVTFTLSGTDNCGIASSTSSANSGDFFAVGTTTVNYTVVDSAGNTDSCSFDITVNDTEAPVAICPTSFAVGNDSGQCGAAVTFTLSGTDNCGIASSTSSANSGDFFAVGTTTVSYTVVDSAGNTDSCSFNITVNDTEAPMAMCPAPITVSNDSGQCGAAVTFTLSNSDNCGVASAVSSANSGDFFAVGTTTVSYVVTDSAGNVDSCSFDITVNDTEAPVAICPAPITVSNDSGQCGAAVTFTLSGTDNCGIASSTSSANSGDFFAVGTTTVSYTVVDSAGNTDSCSFDITVNDTEAPVAICPAPITVGNDSGQCGAAVTFTLSNSDNCGVASTSSSANSGDFFAVGTTTVSYTVTDSAGNVDSCSFDITVNDTEAPMAICPAPINVSNDSGQCGAAVTFTLSSSDNCGVASTSSSANSGDFFAVGTTTVSYVVTDSAGNVDSCSFDITVNDTEAPVAICPAPITVSNDTGQCGAVVTFTLSNSDNCGVASAVSTSNSGDFFPVGVTSVTYVVTDSAGNVDSCAFDITVNDTEAPVAICPAPITVSNDSGQCGAAVTFTLNSSDNCGVASTSSSANSGDFFAVGTTTVNYTVIDSAGNTDSCSFTITVTDDEDPIITCPATVTVGNDSSFCGALVTFASATATDNCTASPTVIQTSGATSGSFFPVGTTNVTFQATDAAGNSSTCTFQIVVQDLEAPILTCPAPIAVNNDSGLCGAVVTYIPPVGSDQCPGPVSTLQTDSTGLSSGDLFPVGVTTLEYTSSDSVGNDTSCTFTITVTDNEAPTIVCPAPISVSNDSGNCSANVSVPAPTAGDNCTPVVLANSFNGTANASGTYPVGVTNVIFTAVDTFGNSDTCSFTVTVTDDELPVIVCPNDTTLIADSADCATNYQWPLPATGDNCGVDSVWSSVPGGSSFPVGVNTVTYFITDVNGNLDSCSFNITVNAPVLAVTLTPSDYNCGHGISCNGESDGDVTVAWTGGCAPYTVAWNTGDSTNTIDSLSAGTYVVTVTDSLGTSVTDSVTLTEPDMLTLSTSSDSLVCFGDSTGTIDLTVMGGNDCEPYDYQWSNGDTTEDLSGLAPGTYTVTVTDVSGCDAITIVEIVSLPLPQIDLGPDTSICSGLVATLDAGAGFVTYDWNTGDTTQSIIAATAGTYSVTITDIFGCPNSDSVTIGVFQVADTFITPREDLLICRQDTLTLDAGTGFTDYSWSTGDSTQAITVAGFGGPITIVAVDSNGCQAYDSVFVQFNDVDNPLPVVVPGPDVNLCDGSTVTLDVLEGYFSYSWNTGDTTQSIDVNTAGDFVVTVTNGFGCIGVSDTVSVTTVPLPTPTIFKQNDTMFVNGTYSTYQWNESNVLIPGAILNFYVPQTAGYYSITVSDSNGCVGVSDSLFCDPTVSAEGATEELFGIELYPNPTSGVVFVRSLEPINWDVDITVMDMYGHLIKTFHVGQLVDAKQLDLTDIANGMYILKVEDKKGRAAMIRFMIE